MADAFKPGEKVKKSGIYTVLHDDDHAENHDVTCISGKVFPLCGECETGVRFRLKHHAQHIAKHEHFKVD
jgi:hypothetical protein